MPYLKTKLTNRICKILLKENCRFNLKNIIINGEKRGCSGHITFIPSGRCVYVNTEPLITDPSKMMYRYAKNEEDFSSNSMTFSAMNQFTTEDKLAHDICMALTMPRDKIKTITRDCIGYR